MDLTPRFLFPWVLVLLALVPWTVWVGMRMRSMSRPRKWTALVLRCLILAALIMALAGAELVRINDKLAVFFLLDRSNSIPEEFRQAAVETVKQTCETYMADDDEVGVIVFGEQPSIEQKVEERLGVEQVHSYVGGEQTDIAAAVRLAMAAFPQGHMKRMVVYTDGNETTGSVLEEIKLGQAAGIEVNVAPLEIGQSEEVRIREVNVPARVNTEEPFKLQVIAESEQDCNGILRIYQRMREGKRLLQSAEVTLQQGANAFLLPQELRQQGFYEYEATIESTADTVFANNVGRAFTVIQGEPRVLYLESDPEHSTRLGQALVEEGLNVVMADLASFPTSLAGFQDYDAVVLSNISSTDLTTEQIRSLEAMVRDLGIGLVMIGGPDSFGAGGYYDSAVERALPVNMDIKERKVMPRGALVLIMHTCEIPEGNAWAREIGMASLNVLASQDLMGGLGYLWNRGDDWIFPLQPVGDKRRMQAALANPQIGDMPATGPSLQMAYDALVNADAAAKRVVIISDGDAQQAPRALLKDLVKAKITVSTVCISPHSLSDQRSLRTVAEATGGEYYLVMNPTNLPQIFTKEAATVKRGLLIEREFIPQAQYASEILRGVLDNGLPQLRGYVVTTPKENAVVPLVSDEADPILAHWRYGLGKSVAFTSDVTTRWAPHWMQWDGFNRFWAQTVRWATRDTAPTSFQLNVRAEGGWGHVRIDAVDEEGRFVNFLRPHGVVTGPAPNFARSEESLSQTGPGIYEGRFPVNEHGTYMINLLYTREDGSQGMLPTGLALGYSPEYEYHTSNMPLLEEMAVEGGGALVNPGDNPFIHNLEASATITPIWPYLVAFALCLFPVEIFVRRVVVDFMAPLAWLAAFLRWVPGVRRIIPAPGTRLRPLTGAYGAMRQVSKTFVYSVEGTGVLEDAPAIRQRLVTETAAQDATSPEAGKKQGSTEYTAQLLAAKERALDKRGRKSRSEETGENE
ncbi:MAG: glutamine amidotransferase [Candidatus Hydrogenedentota bacterium]